MEDLDIGTLTRFLNAILAAVERGQEYVGSIAEGAIPTFVVLEVFLFGLGVYLGMEQWGRAVLKGLAINFWLWVVRDSKQLCDAMFNGLLEVGATAGGWSNDPQQLLNPSQVADMAFTATVQVQDKLGELDFISDFASCFVFALVLLVMMAMYLVIALTVMWVRIEYEVGAALLVVLLPFGVWEKTRWIAMKPLSFALSCALHMMVLGFVMAVANDFVRLVPITRGDPTFRELWEIVFALVGVAFISLKLPQKIAQGAMAGASSADSGDIWRGAKTGGGAAASALGAAAKAFGGSRKAGQAASNTKAGGWVNAQGSAAWAATGGRALNAAKEGVKGVFRGSAAAADSGAGDEKAGGTTQAGGAAPESGGTTQAGGAAPESGGTTQAGGAAPETMNSTDSPSSATDSQNMPTIGGKGDK